MKVHLLDEGYTWVPKTKDFTQDPRDEILENQGFRATEASYPCYYAPRGRDSSYFSLFSALRAVWLCFFFPKECLG